MSRRLTYWLNRQPYSASISVWARAVTDKYI